MCDVTPENARRDVELGPLAIDGCICRQIWISEAAAWRAIRMSSRSTLITASTRMRDLNIHPIDTAPVFPFAGPLTSLHPIDMVHFYFATHARYPLVTRSRLYLSNGFASIQPSVLPAGNKPHLMKSDFSKKKS